MHRYFTAYQIMSAIISEKLLLIYIQLDDIYSIVRSWKHNCQCCSTVSHAYNAKENNPATH